MGVPAVLHLDQRNAMAEKVIANYAREHSLVDAGSGAALGLLPLGNLIALGGQLVYSGARVYPAMLADLAAVYQVNLDAKKKRKLPLSAEVRELIEGGAEDAALDILTTYHTEILQEVSRDLAAHPAAAHLVANITNDFGTEHLQEIANELLAEHGPAVAVSCIPILGAVAGVPFDAYLGAMMTWRVGATGSAYFQHGGYIGSRERTYKHAKPLVARSFEWERPGTLTRLRRQVQPIRDRQLEHVRELKRKLPGSRNAKRSELVDRRGVPADLFDSA
jgi:hypothetical protein